MNNFYETIDEILIPNLTNKVLSKLNLLSNKSYMAVTSLEPAKLIISFLQGEL